MTEEEWLECDDPEALVAFLGSRASERKLRLFAVTCCRQVLQANPSACAASTKSPPCRGGAGGSDFLEKGQSQESQDMRGIVARAGLERGGKAVDTARRGGYCGAVLAVQREVFRMRRHDVPPDSFSDRPIRRCIPEADEDLPGPADGFTVLLMLRLAGTVIAAAAFVGLCWLARHSVSADPRILAGPLLFDPVSAAVGSAILLPCMFAVGVRANTVTITLAIIAALFWIGLGLFSEISAGC